MAYFQGMFFSNYVVFRVRGFKTSSDPKNGGVANTAALGVTSMLTHFSGSR